MSQLNARTDNSKSNLQMLFPESLTCLLVQVDEKMCGHDDIVVSVLALSLFQVLA